MSKPNRAQGIIKIPYPQYAEDIRILAEQFLLARKAENLTAGTLRFYVFKLKLFIDFCEAQQVKDIASVSADLVRRFMLYLEGSHNAGGCHAAYRALRTFLRWYEREFEPEGWKNPIKRVKAPRLAIEPLEPVSSDTIQALLDTCAEDFTGKRDRVIILALLDTGARANELMSADIQDVDLISGAVLIRRGKGRKPRTVYLGKRARKELRRYLRARQDTSPALWVTGDGERLTYWGLRSMIQRRAKLAGVEAPELHAFRRAFALAMLRAGTDVYTLQKLMGHSDLQVLRRYLAQTDADLAEAHRRASPADFLQGR